MTQEEFIQKELIHKFSFLENKIIIPRQRRIFIEVNLENFKDVFTFIVQKLNFLILCAITGVDNTDKFGVIYHLARESGVVLSLKTNTPRENPVIETITKYFINAEIYERELVDLFGIDVKGLQPGKRYPLPDSWPAGQFPLRKDWKKEILKDAKG